MTIKQRIRKCLKSWDGETDTIEKIVAVAYYMGREDAAREICNKIVVCEEIKGVRR